MISGSGIKARSGEDFVSFLGQTGVVIQMESVPNTSFLLIKIVVLRISTGANKER